MNWLSGMTRDYGVSTMPQSIVDNFYNAISNREEARLRASRAELAAIVDSVASGICCGDEFALCGHIAIVTGLKRSRLNGIVVFYEIDGEPGELTAEQYYSCTNAKERPQS